MTTRGDRSALSRYIDLLAGKDAPHTEVAARINEMNPGAKVAGTLVSRWRAQLVEVSPGNLAALARAYNRSPLEAFVVAGLLELDEAAPGLDEGSRAVLDLVWDSKTPIRIVLGEELPDPEDPHAVADFLRERAKRKPGERTAPPATQKRAARKKPSKPTMGEE